MTDPILFSTRKTPSLRRDQSKVLTNQDWKANEIKDWMNEHLKHCGQNKDCQRINKQENLYDRELTKKLNSFFDSFQKGSFDKILDQLNLIAE